jgi:hypothetical protein
LRKRIRDDGSQVKFFLFCCRRRSHRVLRFGNWAVQRCLEAASTQEERKKIVACMRYFFLCSPDSLVHASRRGRIVELATNCYGCHVLQKALDCEEDIRLAIVSELLLGDPSLTLVNKHASHVWSKVRVYNSSTGSSLALTSSRSWNFLGLHQLRLFLPSEFVHLLLHWLELMSLCRLVSTKL